MRRPPRSTRTDTLFSLHDALPISHDGFACNGATDPATYRGGDRREERDLEQVHLLLGFDGVGYLDDDYYVLSALSTLFGGGMSSRLFQEVREKRGLVYSVYARSEEHTSELQSLMRISYAVFCLKKKKRQK